jgi:hypothetical protein
MGKGIFEGGSVKDVMLFNFYQYFIRKISFICVLWRRDWNTDDRD